jgi:hypothetical protein
MRKYDIYLGADVEPSAEYISDLECWIRKVERDKRKTDVLAKAIISVDRLAERIAEITARLAKVEAFERGQRRE